MQARTAAFRDHHRRLRLVLCIEEQSLALLLVHLGSLGDAAQCIAPKAANQLQRLAEPCGHDSFCIGCDDEVIAPAVVCVAFSARVHRSSPHPQKRVFVGLRHD
jgi:hypothetical protein